MDQAQEKVELKGVQKVNFEEVSKNLDEIKEYATIFNDGDKAKQYDDRADKYDYILKQAVGYGDPDVITKGVTELNLPKETRFIDFGAGTGLVGDALKAAGGYTHFDGLDASS